MFSLKQDQHIKVLHKSNTPCVCPYQTKIAIPVPHRLDPRKIEMQIQQFNCTSACQFFFEHVNDSDQVTEVTTQCTGTRFEIEAEKKGFSLVK